MHVAKGKSLGFVSFGTSTTTTCEGPFLLIDMLYLNLTIPRCNRVLSDGFGVESLIPASCYSSTPLPSPLPDFDSDTQHINKDANEDQGLSSKDQEKLKEETQRMRLEQTYLVHRASYVSPHR